MASSLITKILKSNHPKPQLQRLLPVRQNAPLSSTPSPTTPSPSSQPPKRGTVSKLLLFLPGAITFGLGTWQLFRRQEKVEMLEYRRKRLEMDPLRCGEVDFGGGSDLEELEFRRVICEGDFDESKSVFVGPRSRSISGVTENGYYVITPLIPRGSGKGSLQQPVLVNRGWVPRSWRTRPLDNTVVDEKPSSPETDAKLNERITWWKFWAKTPKSPEANLRKSVLWLLPELLV